MPVCAQIYAAAPEMKNHLSMLGSIGAGAMFSFCGMGGSWSGLTRLGDCLTVRLVLWNCQFKVCETYTRGNNLRRDVTWLGLASDELLPSLSTLTDNVGGIPRKS